jgi:TatD DNase family protein
MYLNIHSHSFSEKKNTKTIFNFIVPWEDENLAANELELPEGWLSVGVHPWYISESDLETQLHWLRRIAANDRVKLIGECGLDRLKGADLQLQETVFREHIRLANELNKPLVVHCVRCFNELLSIKKVLRPKVPIVVHGFNANLQIGEQLMAKDFYFSLGAALLNQESNASQLLEKLPLERLFLETDDADISVQTLYKIVAERKGISSESLQNLLYENFLML